MKQLIFILFLSFSFFSFNQNSLVKKLADGRYTLSDEGASYFAKLSLDCTQKEGPHYFFQALRKKGDTRTPKTIWPSFYGCYDWHSSVHNHWCMIKILKLHPNITEAKEMRERLEESFKSENILKELDYVRKNDKGLFEFPYGQCWLLKVADELVRWDDPDAQRWVKNLKPLSDYIALVNTKVWPQVPEYGLSGSHDSPALGLSFAYDYSVSFKNKKLKKVIVATANRFYGKVKNVAIVDEPYEYDFMSASLLVADLMRKTMSDSKYQVWVKDFCPDLFVSSKASKPLQIKRSEKHDGYESHWDGYHLNRIWCLNGMLIKLGGKAILDNETKSVWINSMNEMWDYAQESIGKGNYDIDHWLSSFSVFALVGYE